MTAVSPTLSAEACFIINRDQLLGQALKAQWEALADDEKRPYGPLL